MSAAENDSTANEVDVSVVIATRNRRALLAETIGSVRMQAGVTFEILVVDDASDDDTWSYLSAESGLRSFRQQVRGERSRARNVGLSHARGRYVMFLDDDDLLRPRALSILAGALDRNPDAIAAVGARWDWFVHEHWGLRDTHPRFERKRMMFEEFLFGWSAISGQCLYRTKVIRDVGGYDNNITFTEDRDLWLRIARRGPVVIRPETVMTYRVHRVQDRPPDIRQLRERVARRAIKALPRDKRRSGLLVRRCYTLMQQAEDEMRARHPIHAIRNAARAVALQPKLLLAPLIGTWVLQRLLRGAAHSLKSR